MREEGGGKSRGIADQAPPPPYNHYYGTFQGVANYPPPPPPIGLPQPAPSGFPAGQQPHYYGYQTVPGVANYPPPPPPIGLPQPAPPGFPAGQQPHYYGYQTVPGYVVPEIRIYREERLPCCGVGLGWFLFITGFFLGAVPWYIGAFLLLCARLDHREKAGLIACTIAALLASIAVTFSMTTDTYMW